VILSVSLSPQGRVATIASNAHQIRVALQVFGVDEPKNLCAIANITDV
jgi:hypothetical protein